MSAEQPSYANELSGIPVERLIAELQGRGYVVEPRRQVQKELLASDIDDVRRYFLGQYDLAEAALRALDFQGPEIPSKDHVQASLMSLSRATISFLRDRLRTGQHDKLVLARRIAGMGLLERERPAMPSLIERFDGMAGITVKTAPSLNWKTYTAAVHDGGRADVSHTFIVLGDVTYPDHPERAANNYNEDGLVYTGYTARDQLQLVQEEASRVALHGTLVPLRIGQMVLLNTMRRLEGKPLLGQIPGQEHHRPQPRTITRLLSYPIEYNFGSPFVATVSATSYSGPPQMELALGGANRRYDVDGCRRMIQLP